MTYEEPVAPDHEGILSPRQPKNESGFYEAYGGFAKEPRVWWGALLGALILGVGGAACSGSTESSSPNGFYEYAAELPLLTSTGFYVTIEGTLHIIDIKHGVIDGMWDVRAHRPWDIRVFSPEPYGPQGQDGGAILLGAKLTWDEMYPWQTEPGYILHRLRPNGRSIECSADLYLPDGRGSAPVHYCTLSLR